MRKHAQAGHNGPNAAAQRKSRQKKMERLNMESAAAAEGRKIKVSYEGQAQDEDMEFLVLPVPGCLPARRITCHLLGG